MKSGRVKRREFISLLGSAIAWPLAARAQQRGGRIYRIGILGATSLRAAEGFLNAFRDGMRERGYVEGQNLAIEYRAPRLLPSRTGRSRPISCAAATMSSWHGPHRR
jgi:hypothetical protein